MVDKIQKKMIKKRLIQGAFFLLAALILSLIERPNNPVNSEIEDLFEHRKSDVMVEFTAQTKRVLTDDTQGSKHQRFIVDYGALTILIAHNIDLAPRVPIEVGDLVKIRGEYEWNEQGGVVHWTHHDPQKKRVGGWIELAGKKYK
ncbi:DUF3465 domain-containing protein [Marinicella sp. S1101]|uniref:DUF3465 domain-containing protein n=1 Tax=Marinicella marina TaxID=2996016 RepID=UPI002261005F|nr:DUF3465 domain-containing protein [Marinicella marina]MCX7553173.1 DUF3465 domain-containing protein [Marinicella marina]MDJ1138905.1 DUF3465 domain-containing protein [Marinicella marina]